MDRPFRHPSIFNTCGEYFEKGYNVVERSPQRVELCDSLNDCMVEILRVWSDYGPQ